MIRKEVNNELAPSNLFSCMLNHVVKRKRMKIAKGGIVTVNSFYQEYLLNNQIFCNLQQGVEGAYGDFCFYTITAVSPTWRVFFFFFLGLYAAGSLFALAFAIARSLFPYASNIFSRRA